MHFRDSPDSLSGLGIPGNIWFRRFAVTYIYTYILYKLDCVYVHVQGLKKNGRETKPL